MKTVFTNRELPHAWFHGTAEHGRNSGDSFYFKGEVIYSYGNHFPIAKKFENITLVTNHHYSVTTSSHISSVISAIAGKYIRVNNVLADSKPEHRENFNAMKREIQETLEKASRARTAKDDHVLSANNLRLAANIYSKQFKLGVSIPELPVNLSEIKEMAKREDARQKAAEKRRKNKILKENNDRIKAWLNGGINNISIHVNKTYMRVNGDRIETSEGVHFPIDDAKIAWRMVSACVKRKASWESNGEKIGLGHYMVDKITKTGTVHAQCHVVEFDQIERCAKELGLI